MTFEAFAARAREIFDQIPPSYKEGVEGLEVTRKTVLHPTLPEVYTLGECVSEHYPSEFGGAGDVHSMVNLYYGSFLELSRSQEEWDWEEELWETITHELRHHLEHLALDDSLGDMDRAEDENFARREGRAFDPFFFRDGVTRGAGLFEVDGDLFAECAVDYRRQQAGKDLVVEVDACRIMIPRPDEEADVHFVRIAEPPMIVAGDFYVVLVRKRGLTRWIRDLFGSRRFSVRDSDMESSRR